MRNPLRYLRIWRAGVACVALALWSGLADQTRYAWAQQEMPDWTRTRSDPQYPASEYLLGMGLAPTSNSPAEALEQAAARSRADMARQIRTHVRQVLLDSITEESALGVGAFSRFFESVRVETSESTAVDLEGVEIARQWIGPSTVAVLSALHRETAASRARGRIEQMRPSIEAQLDELRQLVSSDPLAAFGRISRTEALVAQLIQQYQILSGVTRRLALPPPLEDEIASLRREIRDGVRAAVVIRDITAADRPVNDATYTPIESFLVDLGWRISSGASLGLTRGDAKEELKRTLSSGDFRYLVLIEAETRNTETVRIGSRTLSFFRAAGNLELIDLVDDEIIFETSYAFPAETKVAHRNASTARRRASERLYDLMLSDLATYLGSF